MSQFEPRRQSHRIIHAIASLLIGTLLALAMAITDAKGAEGTANELTMDQITGAVAAIETGARWIDTGDVRGQWRIGSSGEVSYWQLTDAALSDLGLSAIQKRKVGRSVVYAESVFRLWYTNLLHKTGSHREALAAFHRGLGGRHREDARTYAARVLNLAGTL